MFVLIPQFVLLLVGTFFLFAGFLGRQQTRHKNNDKLEVLMVRIGIFSVLYTVPATCVVASLFYEYSSREQWLKRAADSRPNIEIFMLKIFMSLVVGITTGMWIWSGKTVATWKNLCKRFTRRKEPLPSYLQPPQRLPQTQVIRLDRTRNPVKTHEYVYYNKKRGETVV